MIKIDRELIYSYLGGYDELSENNYLFIIDCCITLCQREANKQLKDIIRINPYIYTE